MAGQAVPGGVKVDVGRLRERYRQRGMSHLTSLKHDEFAAILELIETSVALNDDYDCRDCRARHGAAVEPFIEGGDADGEGSQSAGRVPREDRTQSSGIPADVTGGGEADDWQYTTEPIPERSFLTAEASPPASESKPKEGGLTWVCVQCEHPLSSHDDDGCAERGCTCAVNHQEIRRPKASPPVPESKKPDEEWLRHMADAEDESGIWSVGPESKPARVDVEYWVEQIEVHRMNGKHDLWVSSDTLATLLDVYEKAQGWKASKIEAGLRDMYIEPGHATQPAAIALFDAIPEPQGEGAATNATPTGEMPAPSPSDHEQTRKDIEPVIRRRTTEESITYLGMKIGELEARMRRVEEAGDA